MMPAVEPPQTRDQIRLLAVDTGRGRYFDRSIRELPQLLGEGDVVVLNDAATLPASLMGHVNGQPIELRLAGRNKDSWTAVLFGLGDWRSRTEDRDPPPLVYPGKSVKLDGGLEATVVRVSLKSPRLVELKFNLDEASLLHAIYAHGHPVQYAHQNKSLDLWSVQTVYGSNPWAVEMPSAGRPLTWKILLELRRRGVDVLRLTHAAGLSSTGDKKLDRSLPLPECYNIPETTVVAIRRAQDRGHRVIAVGTSVVRALEGCVNEHGELRSGRGMTDLRIDVGFVPQVADGILSGMHHAEESHYQVIKSFASSHLMKASWNHALAKGYRCHEFGDVGLWLPYLRDDALAS